MPLIDVEPHLTILQREQFRHLVLAASRVASRPLPSGATVVVRNL
jgi:hypothetical protein